MLCLQSVIMLIVCVELITDGCLDKTPVLTDRTNNKAYLVTVIIHYVKMFYSTFLYYSQFYS